MRGRSTMPTRDAAARGSGRPMLQRRRSGAHASKCEAKQFSSGRTIGPSPIRLQIGTTAHARGAQTLNRQPVTTRALGC